MKAHPCKTWREGKCNAAVMAGSDYKRNRRDWYLCHVIWDISYGGRWLPHAARRHGVRDQLIDAYIIYDNWLLLLCGAAQSFISSTTTWWYQLGIIQEMVSVFTPESPVASFTKEVNSPVKIWKDPPQIATKTKLPPSCRKFCVDFKNEKFTKINRVEPFQISYYIVGPWEKLLKKNSNLYFFHNYEK